jgi:hypothetical protein
MAATSYKAKQTTIGKPQPYASELNWLFRRGADAVASSSLKGSLVKFGSKASPILSGVAAFTAGYNASVAGQCLLERSNERIR